MYTLFSNAKLGMLVEQMRLAETRRQIEAQRIADEINPTLQCRITQFLYRALQRLKVSSGKSSGNTAQYDGTALN